MVKLRGVQLAWQTSMGLGAELGGVLRSAGKTITGVRKRI